MVCSLPTLVHLQLFVHDFDPGNLEGEETGGARSSSTHRMDMSSVRYLHLEERLSQGSNVREER